MSVSSCDSDDIKWLPRLLMDVNWGMDCDIPCGDCDLCKKVYPDDWHLIACFDDRAMDEYDGDDIVLNANGDPPPRVMKFTKDTTVMDVMEEIASGYRCGIFEGIERIAPGVYLLMWGT